MESEGRHEPVAPEVEERVRASFARSGIMDLLGARLGDIRDGLVEVELDARPEVSQQHGFIHAGATSTIVDSAGGYAALTRFEPGEEVMTVEYKLNFMAPAAGDRIVATGTLVRAGRTLSVCRLDVHSVDGDRRIHIATGMQTLIRVSADRSS